jgi:hypothetical protein
MLTNTVSPTCPAVKLSDDTQAGIKGDTLLFQHRASLIAAMDLSDAIKLAQMILRHAERCGIDIHTAAADISAAGEDVIDDDDYPAIF